MARSKPSSRENGRLSHGPATQAGMDRSKYNAVRHGLLAQRAVVLEGESAEQYNRLAGAHYQRFQPKDEVEAEIVDEMASAKWRIRRLEAIESFLMNEVIRQFGSGDSEAGIAAAFQALAKDKSLALLLRYESHLKLAYQRSLRNLLQLQKSAPLPEPELQLEPETPATQLEPALLYQRATAAVPNEPIFMEFLRRSGPSEPAAGTGFAPSSPSQPV